MAINNRDVRLGITIDTAGEEDVTRLAASIRALGKEGDPAAAEFNQLADEFDRLATAGAAASARLKDLRDVQATARAQAAASRQAEAALNDEYARSKIVNGVASQTTKDLALARIDATAATRAGKAALAEATAAAREAALAEAELKKQIQSKIAAYRESTAAATEEARATEQSASSFSAVASQIGRFQGAIAAAFVAKPIYDLAVETDTLRRVLTQTEGSVEGAERQMEFLRSTAQRAGVSVTDISQSFVRFNAAARSSGISGQVVNDVFEATTRAAGNLGLSSEKVTLILDALGQMASKGVVQMEELRGQLGDSLPGALGLLAKGLGLTQSELVKLVESGQLLTRDALPALATALASVGGNGAQVEGLSASFNRLKNTVTEAGQALIDGPIGAGAGLALTGLGKAIESVAVIAVGFNQALGVTGKTLALVAAALTGNIASFAQFKTEFALILDDAAGKVSKFEDHVASSGAAAKQAGVQAAEAGQQVAAGAVGYTQAATAAAAAAEAHTQAGTAATGAAGAHADLATQTAAAGVAATNTTVSFAKLLVDYAAVTAEVERQVKLSEKVVAAKKIEGEAAVAAVRVSGDAYTALLAESAAAENNARATAALAEARRTEVAVLEAQIAAETALAAKLGDPDGSRQKQIDALKKSVELKTAEAEASGNTAKALQTEATVRELAVKAYGDNSAAVETLKTSLSSARAEVEALTLAQSRGFATQEQVNDAVTRASAVERLYRDALADSTAATTRRNATIEAEQHLVQAGIGLEQARAQATIRAATVLGDERLALEANVRAKQLQIQAIESSVTAKNKETDATIANLQQQRAAIDATDPLIKQKQEEIDARIKNAQAMKLEAAAQQASVTAILAETEALQRRSQAAAFANTAALDLSGLTRSNAADKAASDASNKARQNFNNSSANAINDSVRVDLQSRYKTGGLTAADSANAQANLQAAKNNYLIVTTGDPTATSLEGRREALSDVQIAQAIVDRLKSGQVSLAPGIKPGNQLAPGIKPGSGLAPQPAPSSAGNTTHVVSININGQKSTVNTASANDATVLAATLKALETSAKSAGY